MRIIRWSAALGAALSTLHPAYSQDVTLTALDGGIVLSGQLQGFDGEFYRVDTSYGLLTIDGQGVICDGTGCPDMTSQIAVVRIIGAPEAGIALLPPLFASFAASRGLGYAPVAGSRFVAKITDPATGNPLAEFSFEATPPETARAALTWGRAELAIAVAPEPDFGHRTLALDAAVPIVSPGNPTPQISALDLVLALAGKVQNWRDVGGPDMPLVVHALSPEMDNQSALAAPLGQPISTGAILHPDQATLAAAVARDPWALAITGRALQGQAKALTLTDSCGFPMLPTPLAVKAEDYPLSLPIFLLTPRRRLPLFAREFLDFLATPAAQNAIRNAGFIDRGVERQALVADGYRLINAIRGAGDDVTMVDLKRLAIGMAGAERVSLTFRFEDGSSRLDAQSADNLTDLARLLETGAFQGQALVFAGFSDGSGTAQANLDLAHARAATVADALRSAAPDLDDAVIPSVDAFGESLPMACDTTAAGRRLNRRVELWAKPLLLIDTPAP